jgi:Cof subfamily protein (haloacid dehalogenase superfamily)
LKLTAIDLDGTLLSTDGTIHRTNAEAIREAQARGITVVIATGRSLSDAKRLLKAADLSCPVIAVNGAVVEWEGECIRNVFLSNPLVESVWDLLKNMGIYYQIYTQQGIFASREGQRRLAQESAHIEQAAARSDSPVALWHMSKLQLQQQGLMELTDESALPRQVHKFLCFSTSEEQLKSIREWTHQFEELIAFSSGAGSLEITSRESQKGIALRWLAERLGIPMEETAAIGDSENDWSMLTAVGLGIAMGNADSAIRQVCRHTTLTNDQNGVAHAFHTWIFPQVR